MYDSARLVWAVLVGVLAAGARAQETGECSCSGLDYTNGGSYLIDGTSEDSFTFTSLFQGACFDASITPILISPEGYGYQCTPIQAELADVEQPSTW